MNDLNPLIQIKGLRDGLLVSLDDAPWDQQLAALISQVDAQPLFFQGAKLALDVSSQILHVNDLVDLRDKLSDRGIFLWAVISESPTTEKTSQLLGLATRIAKPQPEESKVHVVEDIGEESALFLNRTIRSGTRTEFPGNIVILGDVNPGAEIIAEGNVIIWGKLRGMVHAGAGGNSKAIVCALDFSPTQLRIADGISEVNDQQQDRVRPQMASVNEIGKLEIVDWQIE